MVNQYRMFSLSLTAFKTGAKPSVHARTSPTHSPGAPFSGAGGSSSLLLLCFLSCQYLLHSSDSNQSKPVSSDVLSKITSKGGKCWKFEREEARWAEEGLERHFERRCEEEVVQRSILLLLPQANLYFEGSSDHF